VIRLGLAACATAGVLALPLKTGEERAQVLVTTHDGRPVEGLQRHDFVVRADDVPLRILSLSPPPLPTSAILLVDASVSTSLWHAFLESIRRDFLAAVGPEDEIMAGGFAEHVRLGGTFSSDPAVIQRELRHVLSTAGMQPSRVWDAVDAAITALSARHRHRVVLLVTDGHASGNVTGIDDVAARAVKEDVTICTIGLAPMTPAASTAPALTSTDPNHFLMWLSAVTGGVYVNAAASFPLQDRLAGVRAPRIGEALATVLRSMRSRYVVAFDRAPVADNGPALVFGVAREDVRVHARQRLRCPDAGVRARRGRGRLPRHGAPPHQHAAVPAAQHLAEALQFRGEG